jgi:hypothetical protein
MWWDKNINCVKFFDTLLGVVSVKFQRYFCSRSRGRIRILAWSKNTCPQPNPNQIRVVSKSVAAKISARSSTSLFTSHRQIIDKPDYRIRAGSLIPGFASCAQNLRIQVLIFAGRLKLCQMQRHDYDNETG